MTRTLTLLDSGAINQRTIDRVLQSVVFFADRVAIRASYHVASEDRSQARQIDRRVDDLREQGLVSFWAHEYEVDDAGRVDARYAKNTGRRSADVVIGAADLSVRLSEMNEMLRATRAEAYRQHPTRPLRQGIAEVVSLRNHLSWLVVSSELDQDGLLANPAARASLAGRGKPVRPTTFREAVAQEVVGQLQLGPLSVLTTEEITAARRYNAGFRRLLDESLLAVSQGMDPVITPSAAAHEIVGRYREMTNRLSLRSDTGEVVSDVAFDILGMAVPPSVLVKYAVNAFRWRRRSTEVRPYLLLLHLERRLGRAASRTI